jgi:hypothetical protein
MRDLIAELGGASRTDSGGGRDLIAEMGGIMPAPREESKPEASRWEAYLSAIGAGVAEDARGQGSAGRAALATAGSLALAPVAGIAGLAKTATSGVREGGKTLEEISSLPGKLVTADEAPLMETVELAMKPFQMAGRGIAGLAEASTSDPFLRFDPNKLQAATDVVEGRSAGSHIGVPIAATIGEVSAMFGLPGVPKAAKSWWNTLPHRKRVMVVDQIKADIAGGEFTGPELRELWKNGDDATRAELLKRYQGVGEEVKPAAPRDILADMEQTPGRDVLAEIGMDEPRVRGQANTAQPPDVINIPPMRETTRLRAQFDAEAAARREGTFTPPTEPEIPKPIVKAEQPSVDVQRSKDILFRPVSTWTPEERAYIIDSGGVMGLMGARKATAETPAAEIVQPGANLEVVKKQKSPDGVIGRISQMGGINVYDDYNAPEMRQFPDMTRVMRKSGVKPDEMAANLNDEGFNVGSGDELIELIKSGKGRNVFTPDKNDALMERQIRREENAWIENQLADEGIDPRRSQKGAGNLQDGLIDEIKAEGVSIHDEAAALKEAGDFFLEVAQKPTKQTDLAGISAAETFSLANPETEIARGPLSKKDMTPTGKLDISTPMTSKPGTANIPPETTPKAVGGNYSHPLEGISLSDISIKNHWQKPLADQDKFWRSKKLQERLDDLEYREDLTGKERDELARLKAMRRPVVKLKDVLDAKSLYEKYPDAAEIPVRLTTNADNAANWSPQMGMGLKTYGIDDLKQQIIHEVTHYLQYKKNPAAHDLAALYDSFTEKEARASRHLLDGTFDRNKLITDLPNPPRPPEGGGQSARGLIGSERGSIPIKESEILQALLKTRGKIADAMPHLETLGRSVYEGGKQKFLDWQAHMKTKLGDLWEGFRGYLKGIWDRLQGGEIGPLGNNRGSVNLGPAVDEVKSVLSEVKQTADEYLGAISTRLGNIDPSLKNTLRAFEFRRGMKASEAVKKVLPFIEKADKMPKADKAAFDLARKNGDPVQLKALVTKYGLGKEYHELRNVLADLYKEASAVGYDVGYRQNYHPRVLKDSKGFLEFFYKQNDWPILEKAIRAKEAELQRYLTDDEKAKVINYMLRGYPSGNISLSKPGQLKAREIETITPALNKFYMDSDGALLRYINDVTDAIEARKLFGKGPKGGKIGNLNDTIGGYVLDLLNKGKIKPEQERIVRDILDARFNEVGTRGIFGLYKNLSYIDTMGSPISAITQVGDLSWALYKNGIGRTLEATGKAIINRSALRKEDIGIERIASEFADTSKAAGAVSKVFKIIGLSKMDNIGKESLINSTYAAAKQKAMTDQGTAALKKELEPVFKGETDQLLKDLRTGNITENVKLYLFNTLSDFQPISLSEMPQKYLSGGNGRIFYMLKSFTLKQFDIYRREIFQKISTEGKRIEGIKNMVYLTAAFVAANATSDFIKDWLLGRPVDIEDKAVDNMLRLLGISKFVTWKAREEGAGSAMVRQISPPFKALDAISKDINSMGDGKGLEITQSIPVVGKLYYWWFGKGAGKSERKQKTFSNAPATLVTPKTLKGLK